MRVRTPFRCSPHPCEYEIAFVSDVEGDLDYFNRWVAGSRCVAYTGSDEAALTLTHARAYFVYGGEPTCRITATSRVSCHSVV